MKSCYYNTQNERLIKAGQLPACQKKVEDGGWLCEEHRYPDPTKVKFEERLKVLKENYQKNKRTNVKLMSMRELTALRDKLKVWLSKNDEHPRYSEGLDKLEAVFEEMRYRGAVNLDGGNK